MHRALPAVIACCACASSGQRMTKAASSVFVRTDSDRTTIITPSLSVAADVTSTTNIEASYEIDAWTGASIDVVTAATGAIEEIRHETDVAVAQRLGELSLSASYRFSIEPDYRSHGGVLGGRVELGRKNTTLGLDLLGSIDTVGRAGDPFFEQEQRSAGARASLTQVLGKRTLAEVAWETTRATGYLASPYRWVAIGGDGICNTTAPFCVPENVPDARLRNSVFARGRRALGSTWSAGIEYRFYFDDWGVRSHAIGPDVAWRITEQGVLSLRYRYYTQGEATFYRPRYFDLMSSSGYATRDRKLSTFFSNEVGASFLQRFPLEGRDVVIVAGGRSTVSGIDYRAFVGLDRVLALELTALVGLEFL